MKNVLKATITLAAIGVAVKVISDKLYEKGSVTTITQKGIQSRIYP